MIRSLYFFIFFTCFSALGSEVILIVKSNGSSHYHFDRATQMTVEKKLRKIVNSVNPNMKVQELVIDDYYSLKNQITKMLTPEDILRGIVFIGHGNKNIFSPDSGHSFLGDQFSRFIISPLFESDINISKNLTVYFHACSLAGNLDDDTSFQKGLNESLSNHSLIESGYKTVDIIAHSFSTIPDTALSPSNTMNHFFVHSGVGIFIENFNFKLSKYLGAYSPKVMQFGVLASSFAALPALGPELGPIAYFTGLSTIFTNFTSLVSTSKYSRLTTSNSSDEFGFAIDLLKASLKKDCVSELTNAPNSYRPNQKGHN